MPSQIVAANTTVQSVAPAVRNGVHIPTSMTIDNLAGGGTRVLQIQDGFTPSATNGDSSPSATTANRFKISVVAGDIVNLSEEDLKGVKCLGSLGIISDVTDASCYISVGYKTE